jgi:AcrR family transcriptional regulator
MEPAGEGTRTRRIRMTAAQRRETILEAATEVFAASGYRAGKVSDVAARIGVTEPVVFQNFGSKAALFAAVLDRLADDVRASLGDLAGHHDSVADLLTRIISPSDAVAPHGPGAHGAISHGRMSHGTLFADAAALIADPEAGAASVRLARIVAAHLADLVRRGQGDGSVRRDVNPEAAAWLVLSVLATRPLRARAAADDSLERDVEGLALRAILALSAKDATAGANRRGSRGGRRISARLPASPPGFPADCPRPGTRIRERTCGSAGRL